MNYPNLTFLTIILIALIFQPSVRSQISSDWKKTYDPPVPHNQGANDVVTDEGGNAYVLGYNSRGYNGTDAALVKYDAAGKFLWARSYDGKNETNSDIGISVTTYSSGGNVFVLTASDVSISGYGNYAGVAKYDSSGNLLWAKDYKVGYNSKVYIMKTDLSGNSYIGGSTSGEAFIMKLNPAGDTSWIRYVYLPSGYQNGQINDIVIDNSGNLFGTGKSQFPNNGNNDLITFKINSVGVFQWTKIYKHTANQDYGNAIELSNSGSVYVTGGSDAANFTPDIVTLKYNPYTGDTVWVKRYNGVANANDHARDIVTDKNGNVILTGQIDGAIYTGDMATLKYDSLGTMMWLRKYAGNVSLSDYGSELAADTSGNIYTGGIARTSNGIKYIGIKYNMNGDSLWTRLYSAGNNLYEAVNGVTLDKNFNLILTGDCNSLDMGTVKINTAGELQWIRIFYGAQLINDITNSIACDKNGNVYAAGKFRVSQFGDQFSVIKYNSSGTVVWIKSYGVQLYDSYDEAKAIAIDNSGYVYITGTSFSRLNNLSLDFLTFKLDTNGNQLWYATFNGAQNLDDDAKAIAVDNAGNVYVTGQSRTSSSGDNYCTIKYNASGNSQWVRYYDGPSGYSDYPYDIAVDNSGNVYVTGQSGDAVTGDDIATIKYNSSGNVSWINRFNGTANGADLGNTIEVDKWGNAYVCGMTKSTGTGYNSVLLKYGNDALGTLRWSKQENGNSTDIPESASSIKLDSGNTRIYLAGTWASVSDGKRAEFAAKYDSSGYRIFRTSGFFYIYGSESFAAGITTDNNQRVYTAGHRVYDGSNKSEITFTAYDSSMTPFYGFQSENEDFSISPNFKDIICANNSGEIFIGGGKYDSTAGNLMSLIKYKIKPFELNLNLLLEGFYNSASNTMTSDTINVYLRYAHNFLKVDSAKGVINNTGNVLLKFTSNLLRDQSNYYMEIRHRNSIETWGALNITFPSGSANYTLYSSSAQAYGSNQTQVDLSPVRFAIYSGDVNQDGTVDLTDGSLIDNDAFNFAAGYLKTDVNGDGVIDLADGVFADNNGFNFVSKITP